MAWNSLPVFLLLLYGWCFVVVCKIQSISAFSVGIDPNAVWRSLTVIRVVAELVQGVSLWGCADWVVLEPTVGTLQYWVKVCVF